MDNLKIGVVGFGNMGSAHAKHIYDGLIDSMTLTAVCDTDPKKLEIVKRDMPGVKVYCDHKEMLSDGVTDAVIIATPHYFHCPIAVDAFSAGQHVLVEKPAGVYVRQIEQMNEAAKQSGKQFCIMFNQRTNMLYSKARELVQSGQLGEIKRAVWIITNWFRTQHYYDSGKWRATWSGEGGGVLLNQAPHNLDLWQWICGMPKKIWASCSVGKWHNIEVEDDAVIIAEYENGATAQFITSTGEYPGTNRFEISGDKGKIVIEDGCLKFTELEHSVSQISAQSNENFATVQTETTVIKQTQHESAHVGILQNFANAILKGEQLISPGYDGINEVTISNAAYLSSWSGEWVELPFDGDRYYNELEKRIHSSKQRDVSGNTAPEMKYSERWRVRW